MKSANSSFVRTVTSTLLCLFACASASFAATNPLSYPRGLAVDAKGNLWVANSGDSNIVVFGPGYVQQKADTITEGISNPTAIAFDPQGNLWVANDGASNGGANGSISEYTAGKQNTTNSIIDGILAPNAIAVDGLGDIWVANDYSNIYVYSSPSVYAQPTALTQMITPSFPVYGIAVVGQTVAWGGDAVSATATIPLLTRGAIYSLAYGETGLVLTSDNSGNVYGGNIDNTVYRFTDGKEFPLVNLSFTPSGIAVDSTRGRIYVSNYYGNSISVYSKASGTLLKLIE